jgi:hypothetical protein
MNFIYKMVELVVSIPLVAVFAVESLVYLIIKLAIFKTTSDSINHISSTIDKIDRCISDVESEIDQLRNDQH